MHPLIQIEGREFWEESAWSILIMLRNIMIFLIHCAQMKRLECFVRLIIVDLFYGFFVLWCVITYYIVRSTNYYFSWTCQIAVDCPRTVPDLSFFQQAEVQKSLERILYTWSMPFLGPILHLFGFYWWSCLFSHLWASQQYTNFEWRNLVSRFYSKGLFWNNSI